MEREPIADRRGSVRFDLELPLSAAMMCRLLLAALGRLALLSAAAMEREREAHPDARGSVSERQSGEQMQRARHLFAAVALLSGCADGSSGGRLVPTFPVFVEPQVQHVNIYAGSATVQVGDTLSVSADSFGADGFSTGTRLPVAWVFSDESLVSRTVTSTNGRTVLLRGIRPGVLRVSATIAQRTGSDTVRVIPALAALRTEPATLTLRRGDSASVRLIVRDLDGAPVQNLFVTWESRDVTMIRFGCCRDTLTVRSLATGGVGETQLIARTANLSVVLPVTVTP